MSHKISIEIETGNAAFEEDPGLELNRIFRDLAWRFSANPIEFMDGAGIMDINGNHVGKVKVTSI